LDFIQGKIKLERRAITYAAIDFMQVFGRTVIVIVEHEVPEKLHDPYVGHEIGH